MISAALVVLASLGAAEDQITVLLPESSADLLEGGGTRGRMILFLRSPSSRTGGAPPADAPFFSDPQPMFSVAVDRLVPGREVVIGDSAVSFPVPLSQLEGRFEAQVVFDRDRTERTHLAPGNLISEIVTIEFEPERTDTATITLSRRIPPAAELPANVGVIWEEMPSERLSKALGRVVSMRAGIVLPRDYHDLRAPRREWPVIYVIPGFGGRHTMALHYAQLVRLDASRLVAPQVAWVVLDPETPFGHHGFCDGDRHGPVATALVKEFIPMLESKYRFVPRPEARIVTGHSSGGWSALWLQLEHPEVFGACFSSAPDPVDFSAFQMSDLYRDESLLIDAEGRLQPSYRMPIGPEYDRVLMTVAQETAMERVLDPEGDSGQQWDAWHAQFSGVDPATGRSFRMFDPETGAIRREVVDTQWSRYDIARRIDREWERLGPVMLERVRLLCGDRDNYYLERAVVRLRDLVERRRAEDDARASEVARARGAEPNPPERNGYIELVPGATHENLPALAMLRWNREIREHLRRHGLAEP